MQIILLSGGSGKRLWPLSNDIRSKQFLRLFINDFGRYESMVERVYRQISSTIEDAMVTIATSKTQVSSINNQLGSKVDVCLEPARRDTFGAIALACMQLAQSNISTDETVIVCPIDPYVKEDYFSAFMDLESIVQTTNCNLALLGVNPTYPSEKYGYIIPKTDAEISQVDYFKEKPSENVAKGYIEQGGLWNCGVFAFKLGYLLDISEKILKYSNYQDLLNNFTEIPKISFDYAVVEKETDISVLRYDGDWKDIGTWNTLCEEMEEQTVGNVIVAEECINSNVINELDIPILCSGINDSVIVAGNDGILVTTKEQSSFIKPFVDKIEQQAMYCEKSWGSFTVLDIQKESLTIKLQLKAGKNINYHSHQRRDEMWSVISGQGKVIIDGLTENVKPGSIVKLPQGCKHTVHALTDLIIIEVQFGKDISADDKELFSFELRRGGKQ